MTGLQELVLYKNSLGDNCAEILVRGLAVCRHLRELNLRDNRIGDDGLGVLSQGLPASVDTLNLGWNEVKLARGISLSQIRKLDLPGNALSLVGPRVIAASLANPESRLETLNLNATDIEDEGAATLAEGLRNNKRLTSLYLGHNNITETGWSAFSFILCDTTSINATHASNHTLQDLWVNSLPQDVKVMLKLSHGKDKNLVAANKILHAHRYLDMRPLFSWRLDLLPHVVVWLERFAGPRRDLKLTSIFDFVRAMPMDVIEAVAGKKKGRECFARRVFEAIST